MPGSATRRKVDLTNVAVGSAIDYRVDMIETDIGSGRAGRGRSAGQRSEVADRPGGTTECEVDFAKVAVESAVHRELT